MNNTARYVPRFVNGAHVVLDTHTKYHSFPFNLARQAIVAAQQLNARDGQRGSGHARLVNATR